MQNIPGYNGHKKLPNYTGELELSFRVWQLFAYSTGLCKQHPNLTGGPSTGFPPQSKLGTTDNKMWDNAICCLNTFFWEWDVKWTQKKHVKCQASFPLILEPTN